VGRAIVSGYSLGRTNKNDDCYTAHRDNLAKQKAEAMANNIKIGRFFFTKESDWARNVRRADSDGSWCRYEDVEPLLQRIKVLEKQKAEVKMKYKLELNKDELNLISQKIYAAWFEIFFTEGDEILSVKDADEKHILSNILQKIKELK
jgi:hypothetical protein